MHKLTGSCHCGNIAVELAFSKELNEIQPRACDCSYCRKHGAAYVSDPQGVLAIRVRKEFQLQKYRQGHDLAEFMLCNNCGVLIGVLYRNEQGRLFAAVNSRMIDNESYFGAIQSVSPQYLSGLEKTTRWQQVWFPDVSVLIDDEERS